MEDVMQAPSVTRAAVVPHVHVRVGACDIAIPIDQVLQALPLPPHGLTALPRRSGALLGVADVAGAAVPIVALERGGAFGGAPAEGGRDGGGFGRHPPGAPCAG